jgi:hypothetical protein
MVGFTEFLLTKLWYNEQIWAQVVTFKIKPKLRYFQAWGQLEFREPSVINTCIYEFHTALAPTTEHEHRNKLFPLQTDGAVKKHPKISQSRAWYCH